MKIAVLGPCDPSVFINDLRAMPTPIPQGLVGTPINGLVRGLLDAGHEVHLISASPGLTSVWRASGGRLSLSVVPYRRRARDRALDLFRIERQAMKAELRTSDADVVHAHWAYEFGWVGVTSHLPCVLTVHDAPLSILRFLPDPYRLLRTIMAYRVRLQARTVTAVSPYLASRWKRQMLYRRSIVAVPNITPDLGSGRSVRRQEPWVVLDIADASRRKNVRALIDAFVIFRKSVPDAELRLIGTGLGATDPFASYIISAEKNIRFLGTCSRDDIAKNLSEASVFCHPSFEESQPMCLLEAMSQGVPVIGGLSAGGVPWTLDNGNAGLLVDVTNVSAIASALRRVHAGGAEIAAVTLAGRQLINERFSPESVVDSYVRVYAQAIKTATRPRFSRRFIGRIGK